MIGLNEQELVWPVLLRPSQAIAGAVMKVPVIRAESYCPVCRAGQGVRDCTHCWGTGRTLAIRWVPVAMPAGVLCEGGFSGLSVPRQGSFDWSERSFGPLRVLPWADPDPEPIGAASPGVSLSVEWPNLVVTAERPQGASLTCDLFGVRCAVPSDAPEGEWRRVPGGGFLRLSHECSPGMAAEAKRGDLILRLRAAQEPRSDDGRVSLLDMARTAQAAGRPVLAMVCATAAGKERGTQRGSAGTLAAARDVLNHVAEGFLRPPDDLPHEARQPALRAFEVMRRRGSKGRFLPALDFASGYRLYRECISGPAWSHPWFRIRALALGLIVGLAHDPSDAGANLAGAVYELTRDPSSAEEADSLADVVLGRLSAEGRAAFCAHWIRLSGSVGLEDAVARAVSEAGSPSDDGSGITVRWLSFWLADTVAAVARSPRVHGLRDALAGAVLGPRMATLAERDALAVAARELRAALTSDPPRCTPMGLLGRLAPVGVHVATDSAAAVEALAATVWAWSRPCYQRAMAAAETLASAPAATGAEAGQEHAALQDLLIELNWQERALHAAGEATERAASASGCYRLGRFAALLDGFRTRVCVTEAHVCDRLAHSALVARAPQQVLRWLDRAIAHANGALVEQARLRHAGLADDFTAMSARRAVATALRTLRDVDAGRPVSASEARSFIENTLDAALQGIVPFATRFGVEETEDVDTLFERLAPELPHLFENSEPMTREFLVDMLPGWYWLTSYRLLLRVPEVGHIQFIPLQSVRSYRVTPEGVTTSTVSVSLRDGRTVNINAMPNRQAPTQEVVEYVLGLKLWQDLPPLEARALSVGGRIGPSQRAALPLYAVPEGLPPALVTPPALTEAALALAAIEGAAEQPALASADEEDI